MSQILFFSNQDLVRSRKSCPALHQLLLMYVKLLYIKGGGLRKANELRVSFGSSWAGLEAKADLTKLKDFFYSYRATFWQRSLCCPYLFIPGYIIGGLSGFDFKKTGYPGRVSGFQKCIKMVRKQPNFTENHQISAFWSTKW